MSPEANGPIINPVSEMWKSAGERPLTLEQVRQVFPYMRQQLLEANINLSPTPEIVAALAESTFPNSREGRGPGVVATLGESKATALISFCATRCANCPKTDRGGENSRGRGLKQITADILELALNESPTDDQIQKLVLRTNQRIKKFSQIRPKTTPRSVTEAYKSVPQLESEQKWREFKAIPYDSVADLWEFLTTK